MGGTERLVEMLSAASIEVTREEIPALLSQLAAIQVQLAARLYTCSESREEYLTLSQLAERIPFAKSTLRAKVTAGKLKEGVHFNRNGRRLVFHWTAIQGWIKEQKNPSGPPVDFEPFVRRGRRHAA